MPRLQCPNLTRGEPHPFEGPGGNGWCRAGCGFNAYEFPTGYERKEDMPARYKADEVLVINAPARSTT